MAIQKTSNSYIFSYLPSNSAESSQIDNSSMTSMNKSSSYQILTSHQIQYKHIEVDKLQVHAYLKQHGVNIEDLK